MKTKATTSFAKDLALLTIKTLSPVAQQNGGAQILMTDNQQIAGASRWSTYT